MTVLNTDKSGSTTLYTFSDSGSQFVVLDSGVIYVDDGNNFTPAIEMNLADQTFRVSGSIYGANQGIDVDKAQDGTTTSTHIVINEGGQIYGGTEAISLFQGIKGAVIDNRGSITSGSTCIEYFTQSVAFGMVVSNSGVIQAGDHQYGIYSNGDASDTITNTGTIIGSLYSLGGSDSVTNTGSISGGVDLQSLAGEHATIQNSGNITGFILFGAGDDTLTDASNGTIIGTIDTQSGNDVVNNAGDIIGNVSLGSLANNHDIFTNSGQISGNFNGGLGVESMTNSGTIDGSINSYSGNDSFVNTGTVTGGVVLSSLVAQTDTVNNFGAIGAAVATGAGNDTVTNAGTIGGNVVTGSGSDALTNSATIIGDVSMSSGSGGKDMLINRGAIVGNVTLGAGDDSIDTHLGAVGGTVTGGAGNDTFIISGTEMIVELTSGGTDTVKSYGDHALAENVENLVLLGNAHIGIGNGLDNNLTANGLGDVLSGGDGRDTIIGGAGDDTLKGGAGDDFIQDLGGDNIFFGGAGNDSIYSNSGDGTLSGGNGDDLLYVVSGSNVLHGGGGNDYLYAGQDDDVLDGGTGIDTVSYVYSNVGVGVNLLAGSASGGYADGDTLSGVENLLGSVYDDALVGSAVANRLDGGAGNDHLSGGDGDDVLIGGAGADSLDGGQGFDTAGYSSAASAIVLDLATGANTGDAAGDIFVSIESYVGTAFNDTMHAATGAAVEFHGGGGIDKLQGSSGSDTLEGGTGNDVITGYLGADIFLYRDVAPGTTDGWGQDTITDFQSGTDHISFVGASAVHGFGDLTITQSGKNAVISTAGGDTITLIKVMATTLSAADFVFGSAAAAHPDSAGTPPPAFAQALIAAFHESAGGVHDLHLLVATPHDAMLAHPHLAIV